MTTPAERTLAILQAREFLRSLTSPAETSGVPASVREEARNLLRHYPGTGDISLAHDALPSWFGPVDTSRRGIGPAAGP